MCYIDAIPIRTIPEQTPLKTAEHIPTRIGTNAAIPHHDVSGKRILYSFSENH